MREISFEMAQELGLIPKFRDRMLTFSFPFESRYGYDKRCEQGENGFKIELASLKETYKTVYFKDEQLKVV